MDSENKARIIKKTQTQPVKNMYIKKKLISTEI